MDITEAIKKIRAEKPKENYMVLTFNTGYDKKLLMPQKEAAALLALLSTAEVLSDRYGEQNRIIEVPRDLVITCSFSHQEYERYKIAALLHITPDEVKDMQAPQKLTPSD
jgi:hypothetical protein